MSDPDLAITAALEHLFPVSGSPDWDAVVRTAGAGARVRRPMFRRPIGRRQLSLPLVVAVLVFAAVSVAAVKEAPWWQSGKPAVDPQEVVLVARDNLPARVQVARARTVVTAGRAALVAVPLDRTGYCLIPAIDGRATLGAQCEYQTTNPQRGDDDRTISVTRTAHGDQPALWVVYGRITDPRATKLDLGAFTLDLATGGFFLHEVPQVQWARLSGSATSGAILDSSGAVLRRGCVNWATSPSAGTTDGEYPLPLWSDAGGGTCKPQKPPLLPTVDLGRAKKLFDVTLTQSYGIWKAGQTVTFEAAPRSDGSTCLVATGSSASAPGVSFTNACGATSGGTSKERPINVEIGSGLTHVDGKAVYAWDIDGTVDATSKITKLELRSATETTPVTFSDGFFFAQFPATSPGPQQGTVTMPAGQWVLVGLDQAGHEVARVDLVELHRQAGPH